MITLNDGDCTYMWKPPSPTLGHALDPRRKAHAMDDMTFQGISAAVDSLAEVSKRNDKTLDCRCQSVGRTPHMAVGRSESSRRRQRAGIQHYCSRDFAQALLKP